MKDKLNRLDAILNKLITKRIKEYALDGEVDLLDKYRFLFNMIAKDYAEAINYTSCCTELPTSTQLLSDCKKRFKELEGKGNLDFRSYKNGYLDSFSKNVISKIK